MNYFKIALSFVVTLIFSSYISLTITDIQHVNQLKDSISLFVRQGILNNEFPGGQIIVVRNNKVIIDSCFGHMSYDKKSKVNHNTRYDLASLTKCFATNFMALKLYDEGKFNDTITLGEYLPKYAEYEIGRLPMTRFLTHSTGLMGSLVLQYKLIYPDGDNAVKDNWFGGVMHNERLEGYSRTFGKSGRDSLYIYDNIKHNEYICIDRTKDYPIKLTDSMYLSTKFYEDILTPALVDAKRYKTGMVIYSDLNFYFLREVLESIAKKRIDKYINETIYSEMMLGKICYNPADNFIPKSIVAPTEYDYIFRKELIQGRVHDEFSSIMGGIEGNAGLFSNARDLLPLCREMLNKHNGFFSAETKAHFLSQPYIEEGNKRALGFQRRDTTDNFYPTSFGHSGFTGTFFQIEPTTKTILIFLSNTIHPTRMNIRNTDERTYLRIWRLLNDRNDKITK